MSKPVRVTDRAVLRYLERAHGLDVRAVRRHLAGRALSAARLGAIGVIIENVKLVLRRSKSEVSVVSVLRKEWPCRDRSGGGES